MTTATRAQAEQRARQWRLDGEAALENNNQAWAKECFAKALDWQTKVNEWDAEPVTDMARSRPYLKVGFADAANGA
ncbi:hypothetical protein [Duganella vulcania]|uniref:Uncharacterized protein n=1 Tax=Duganella vulcania TaxID=2692166 RepID=A0A845GHX3_9BURK|nr:hypothetical protein [Duganella vulcania]MYM92648.1 hypothetical protein [Duganella vulcania]